MSTQTVQYPTDTLYPLLKPELFFHGSTAIVGLGLLNVEVSRPHSDTPNYV
jgi:hypothetical protein